MVKEPWWLHKELLQVRKCLLIGGDLKFGPMLYLIELASSRSLVLGRNDGLSDEMKVFLPLYKDRLKENQQKLGEDKK